jgi:hypothetical protein
MFLVVCLRLKDSALVTSRKSSEHCAGVGTGKVIFEYFIKPAVRASGLSITVSVQNHLSVAGPLPYQATLISHRVS